MNPNNEKCDCLWNFSGSKALSIALIILALFLAVKVVSGIIDWSRPDMPVNIISIQGEGEVFAIPDVATFSVGVTKENKVISTAQKEVDDKINAIKDILKKNGVEDKDIKTIGYNIYPKYEYVQAYCTVAYCPPGKQEFKGYEVSQTVEIKVRDTGKAGELLSSIGTVGVTNIGSLNFTLDDENKVMEEARDKAIQNAKEKAEKLAKELDVKLVRIIGYNEYSPVPPFMYGKAEGLGGDNAMSSIAPRSVSISQGENKYTSTINISYEIR